MNNLKQWCILYTLPKHEKKIHGVLTKMGFDTFLPLRPIMSQWSDRKKKIDSPVFPNYLFVKTFQQDLYKTLLIPGVVKFLSYDGKPASVSDADIEFIKKVMLTNFEVIDAEALAGDRVRIENGPLQGVEGILQWKLGKNKIAIHLDVISKIVVLETGSYQINRVNHRPDLHAHALTGTEVLSY